MKVILHDLDQQYEKMFSGRYDRVIPADGKYAPCQGGLFWLLDKASGGMFYEGQAAAGLPHHRTGG